MLHWPLGVFTSVDAGLGVSWDVIAKLQLPTLQLHAPRQGSDGQGRSESAAVQLKDQLDRMKIACTAVFGGFDGESYLDIPTVVKTVGLVPPAPRRVRLSEMKEISNFARHLGCDTVALHLGFIPEDTDDDDYEAIADVTAELCNHCDSNSQFLHLETGQETAAGLLKFIERVDRSNLKINFDPANMILYGTGDPIEALRELGQHVRSVHCKDAIWSDQPGKTWGTEVPLGEGQVDISAYLRTLKEIGYDGPLTIEHEIPQDAKRQFEEISAAVDLLKRLRTEVGVDG
jgi:sugar phosphate isomerase/epimerase